MRPLPLPTRPWKPPFLIHLFIPQILLSWNGSSFIAILFFDICFSPYSSDNLSLCVLSPNNRFLSTIQCSYTIGCCFVRDCSLLLRDPFVSITLPSTLETILSCDTLIGVIYIGTHSHSVMFLDFRINSTLIYMLDIWSLSNNVDVMRSKLIAQCPSSVIPKKKGWDVLIFSNLPSMFQLYVPIIATHCDVFWSVVSIFVYLPQNLFSFSSLRSA